MRSHKVVARKFKPPKYFEVGTVIPGATEHYTAASKKKRGRTIVQEVLEDEKLRQSIRERFAKAVATKGSYTNKRLNRLAFKLKAKRKHHAKKKMQRKA